jgi:hypothetical protein
MSDYKLFSELLKDTYVGATAYTIGDIVTYNGSSYACRANTTGNLPTNVTYWALLAEKGDTGATGATGTAATATAGTTTTGAPGTSASVTNVGTTAAAVFNFTIPQGATGATGPVGPGGGDILGPSSSTDNAIARFDSTTGKLLQNSGITITDLSGDNYGIYPPNETSGNGKNVFLRGSAPGTDANGGYGMVKGANGNGTGTGGPGYLYGGDGGATGAGGAAIVQGGAGGATSGNGGDANLIGGNATNGDSTGGSVVIAPGAKNGSGNHGALFLYQYRGAPYNAALDLSLIASSNKTFTFQNVSGALATVTSGAGVPTGTAPVAIGQIYIDTSAGKVYIAKGVSAGSDWAILN